MTREYDPKITTLDGLFTFELTNPEYRPVNEFVVRHSRRHDVGEIARRDGGVCFLPGPLAPMRIHLRGSIGAADTSTDQAMRDFFSGAFMRNEEEFFLFKYSDRRATVRIDDSEWPAGRVIIQETEYDLSFVALDPYWYDLSDSSSVQDIVMNGPGVEIEIGGSAPTPVRMQITMPADCTCNGFEMIRMEDVDLHDRTGKGYFEFGDESCCPNTGGTVINYDPRDSYQSITTDNPDCTNALEHFDGYFFKSGPGTTEFELSTPGAPLMDCTAEIMFTWRNRYYLP